jgi:DNA-binding LacI/PurR family transcriptional regulator
MMKDVARLAGCDPSTVSLALRGDFRISSATREKVRAVAAQLGYRVHPMIAAWVSARRAGRPIEQRVSAAYIACHPMAFRWRASEHFWNIFEGAREEAERFGFALEEFKLVDYSRDLARLNQVLVTRNVQGIIVGPTLEHHNVEGIEWSCFSLVTIGYGLVSPALHRVTEDHHLGMKLAFESSLGQGHQRIGLALLREHNAMRRERWISAYLYEQYEHLRPTERIPVYVATGETPVANHRRWLSRYKPDILLADDPSLWRSFGVATLGFALSGGHDFPGVHENNRGIGRSAADLLVSLVLRNERGIPAMRQTILVEPSLSENPQNRPAAVPQA